MLACFPPGLSCHPQTLNGPHQDSSVQNEEAVGPEPYILYDPFFLHRQTNLAISCIAGFRPGRQALAYRVLKGATISWRVPNGATIAWFVSKSETFVWSKSGQNHFGRAASHWVPCAVRRARRHANSLPSNNVRLFSGVGCTVRPGHRPGFHPS